MESLREREFKACSYFSLRRKILTLQSVIDLRSIEEIARTLVRARTGDPEAFREALKSFYQHPYPRQYVRGMVLRLYGQEEDVKDLFHDAIIVFEKSLRTGHYDPTKAPYPYFKGIVRYIWWDRIRARKPTVDLTALEGQWDIKDPAFLLQLQDRSDQLDEIIAGLDERCRGLLTLARRGFSYDEISEKLSIKKELIRGGMYKCRKKIDELLKGLPELRAALKFNIG